MAVFTRVATSRTAFASQIHKIGHCPSWRRIISYFESIWLIFRSMEWTELNILVAPCKTTCEGQRQGENEVEKRTWKEELDGVKDSIWPGRHTLWSQAWQRECTRQRRRAHCDSRWGGFRRSAPPPGSPASKQLFRNRAFPLPPSGPQIASACARFSTRSSCKERSGPRVCSDSVPLGSSAPALVTALPAPWGGPACRWCRRCCPRGSAGPPCYDQGTRRRSRRCRAAYRSGWSSSQTRWEPAKSVWDSLRASSKILRITWLSIKYSGSLLFRVHCPFHCSALFTMGYN